MVLMDDYSVYWLKREAVKIFLELRKQNLLDILDLNDIWNELCLEFLKERSKHLDMDPPRFTNYFKVVLLNWKRKHQTKQINKLDPGRIKRKEPIVTLDAIRSIFSEKNERNGWKYTYPQMAEMLGVTVITLKRACKKYRLKRNQKRNIIF